ncbi:benzoate/H(+) symporter BenE family transporter [Gulosibacter bifidus]|uniref:Benzoate/H(+) symporter BenE family transporter n=1 Tax=Gulosibacter bifidus TaxID=272239 RepID=A0ABW5RJ20_9MICO|nr:benzoate/H(+) symporter BenE family transporter [Gulosibacter bifidus]
MTHSYAKPWKAGPFDIRLPFLHYRFEWQDYTQGLVICAVDMAAIPLITQALGMPFEAALAIVIMNGLLYLLHSTFGDPVIPGWITPAIPLLLMYLEEFPQEQKVHALVAFQLLLGLFSLTLGITKLASRVVKLIPNALRAGIVIGAGIAAVQRVFADGGEFDQFPASISICVAVAIFFMYSKWFQNAQRNNAVLSTIGNFGILPAMLLAVIVAPLVGEAAWPTIEWGITQPDFMTVFTEYTVFGVGFPPIEMFITAIPIVLAAYIVVFGDVIQAEAVLDEANAVRKDENVKYNPNRAHLIFGGRNMVMGVAGPDCAMCGPLWAAMHVATSERYKKGPKAMQSIFSGAAAVRLGTNTGLWLLPIVMMMQPTLDVGLALTLLIQGFVSVRVGVTEARSKTDLGIAGVVAAIIAIDGATTGFAAGVLLTLLIYTKDFFRGEDDGLFAPDPNKIPDPANDPEVTARPAIDWNSTAAESTAVQDAPGHAPQAPEGLSSSPYTQSPPQGGAVDDQPTDR